MVLHTLGSCNILLVHISGYGNQLRLEFPKRNLTWMTGPRNKSLRDGAAVTLNMTKAVRYPSPCYRQVRYVSYIIGHKRIFSIQVELKGDGGCLVMCGPTVHNKRVRIGTQLATNKLSQAAEG